MCHLPREVLTLFNNYLLHLGQSLHCMVGYTISKHDDAEAPFQVIVSELLALVSFHFKVTDWDRMHARCLLCLVGFFTCLLSLSCNSTSLQRHYSAITAALARHYSSNSMPLQPYIDARHGIDMQT